MTVRPRISVIRVDLDGVSGGGTGAVFTLNASTGSVSLVAGANITLNSNLSTITIVGASGASGAAFSLNNSTGSASIVAGGAIGLTNNLSTISISAPVATNFSFNASSSSVSLVAGLGLGISSNASTITIGLITNATGTGAFSTVSLTALGNTTIGSSGTFSNVLQFSGAGIASVGASLNSVTVSVTTPSVVSSLNGSTGAISVSAGAGIGIGQANSTITISASAQTASVSMTALGNTTGSSSGTHTNLLNISGAGIISVGAGAQSITISATTPSVTNFSTISLSASGNTTGASSGTMNNVLALSGAGIVSVGAGAGGSFTVSATTPSVTNYSTISGNIAGNTAGTSTFTIGNTLQISLTGGLSGTASGSSITLSGQPAAGALTQSLSASGNTTGATSSGTYGSVLAVSGMGGISVGAGNGTISISGPSAAVGAAVKYTENVPFNLVSGTIATKAGTITGTAGFGSSLFLHRIALGGTMSLTEIDVAMKIDFPATSQGAGTMSRSMVVYSFGNSTSLASVLSFSGTSTWGTGTSTAGASTSLTQFQGGWSTPLIQPMTFASTSISAGDYVVGQLFNFAQGSSTWTLNLYGALAQSTAAGVATGGLLQVTGLPVGVGTLQNTAFTASPTVFNALSSSAVAAGSGINAITQNATNNVSWFVSRASSAVTSVASATSSFTFLEAPFVGSIGTVAGSIFTATSSGAVISNAGTGSFVAITALQGAATGSIVTSTSPMLTSCLPNFGYIGTGSTTSGFPTAFLAGIMSTGAVPAAITLTSNAVTYSGSAAFVQPWFALVGA